MTDILAKYADKINLAELVKRRVAAEQSERTRQEQYQVLLDAVDKGIRVHPGPWEIRDGAVAIDCYPALNEHEQALLLSSVRGLLPWRKGPFSLGGLYIDSEWRSDFKWERMLPGLPSLAGKLVADVGCSNGYYLLRLAEQHPECIIGFDPSQRCYYQFELLKRFFACENAQFERLGLEDLELFPRFFDVILCLGVIYHQREPLRGLKFLFDATAAGGTVIVESQGIPGDEPMALFPPDRYGKLRNVYFVPTATCLKAWMERSGFVEVEVFSVSETTAIEQRRTEFSPDESLADFLDPTDRQKTVEGWPAPLRIALRGKKP